MSAFGECSVGYLDRTTGVDIRREMERARSSTIIEMLLMKNISSSSRRPSKDTGRGSQGGSKVISYKTKMSIAEFEADATTGLIAEKGIAGRGGCTK